MSVDDYQTAKTTTMEAIEAQLKTLCLTLLGSGAFEKADVESAYPNALWGAAKDK